MSESKNVNVAAITGASRGLGRALCRELLREGYQVVGLARTSEQLSTLAEEAEEFPGDFLPVITDVTDPEQCSKAVHMILAAWGHVDLAIANAGISEAGWAAKQSPEQINHLLQVNFMGMINFFSPLLPGMIERKSGHLVGISSIAGYRGMPALSAYSASKAAMRSYLETLRIELQSRGIAVLTVSPGYIETEMTSEGGRPMPFKISAEKAATLIIKAIHGKEREIIFPFPMAVMTRLLNFLPNSLYDSLIRYIS